MAFYDLQPGNNSYSPSAHMGPGKPWMNYKFDAVIVKGK